MSHSLKIISFYGFSVFSLIWTSQLNGAKATAVTFTYGVNNKNISDPFDASSISPIYSSSTSSPLLLEYSNTNMEQIDSQQQQQTAEVQTGTGFSGPRTALIAELVGLTTLKGFALLAFPILIPLILTALAVVILPLQIFSTPLAAIGRRLGVEPSHPEIDDVLEEILQKTNCIERLSCEVGRNVKTPQVRSIIDQSFSELKEQLEGKWINSLKGYILGSNSRLSTKNVCTQFKCKFVKKPL